MCTRGCCSSDDIWSYRTSPKAKLSKRKRIWINKQEALKATCANVELGRATKCHVKDLWCTYAKFVGVQKGSVTDSDIYIRRLVVKVRQREAVASQLIYFKRISKLFYAFSKQKWKWTQHKPEYERKQLNLQERQNFFVCLEWSEDLTKWCYQVIKMPSDTIMVDPLCCT